jgi:phenylacetate-CoA ligase
MARGEYWNSEIETMAEEKLKQLQLSKIKRLVNYAYYCSPFYREIYDRAGVKPEDIKTLDDMKRLPIISKDDQRASMEREKSPLGGMLTVPLEEIEATYSSAGTTGVPTFSLRTRGEFQEMTEFYARMLWMQGVRPGDRLYSQSAVLHGYVPLPLAGGMKVGASVISLITVPLTAARTLSLIKTLKPTVGFTFPLDAILGVEEEAIKQGYDPAEILSCFRFVATAGEIVSTSLKNRFADKWGLREGFYDYHALSEIWIMDTDCPEHQGNHFFRDAYYIEAIDPDTEEVVGAGKEAEIVVTNLVLKSMPIIRFKTEDMGILEEERCGCGRTHPRVKWLGRSGWRVNVKGKKIQPFAVQQIFERFPETWSGSLFVVKEKTKEVIDTLKIRCVPDKEPEDPEGLKRRMQAEIKKELDIDSEIEWIPYEQLPVFLHKIKRIVEE